VQRAVEAERVAHAHHRDAGRAAEVGQHLPDELVELAFVDHADLLCGLPNCPVL
jgi:hypothetical protein